MKKRKLLLWLIFPVYTYLQNRSLAREMVLFARHGERILVKAADKEAAKEPGYTEKTVWKCLQFKSDIVEILRARSEEYPYAKDMINELDALEIRNLNDCNRYGSLLSKIAEDVIQRTTGPMYKPLFFPPYVNIFDILIFILAALIGGMVLHVILFGL